MQKLKQSLLIASITLLSNNAFSQVERVDVDDQSSTTVSDFDYPAYSLNGVKFSISDAIFGLVGLKYERTLSDRIVIEVGAAKVMSYYKYSDAVDFFRNREYRSDNDYNLSGYNLNFAIRFTNEEEVGYYAYSGLEYNFKKLIEESESANLHRIAYVFGWQFNLGLPNLYLETGIGLGLEFSNYDEFNYEDFPFSFVTPLNLSVGYSF